MKVSNILKKSEQSSSETFQQFANDIINGLSSGPKWISSKYFYDDIGSKIFQKITSHPDYYLTKAEFSILKKIGERQLLKTKTSTLDVVELGAGDGHKSAELIKGFTEQNININYYPIDISEKAMSLLSEHIMESSLLNIHGIVCEYLDGLEYLQELSQNPKLILFLGSNIGNFDSKDSGEFLTQISKRMDFEDRLLIGFDLKKDPETLLKAYNDSAGYTEAFNFNLLNRINNDLDGDFDSSRFQHFGTFNPKIGAMESYLISKNAQSVHLKRIDKTIEFDKFEAIHLEHSYKYSESDIQSLARKSNFEVVEQFYDKQHYFVDSVWKRSSN